MVDRHGRCVERATGAGGRLGCASWASKILVCVWAMATTKTDKVNLQLSMSIILQSIALRPASLGPVCLPVAGEPVRFGTCLLNVAIFHVSIHRPSALLDIICIMLGHA
jgi:hypothetical protein